MSYDIGVFVARLKSIEPRLDISYDDLVELFWQTHPRFQFFKWLPWGANLLDIGAGNGGLVHWKEWLKPQRADLNLYGVDRNVAEYRDLYAGWETVDLDRELPVPWGQAERLFCEPSDRVPGGAGKAGPVAWRRRRSPAPGCIWSGPARQPSICRARADCTSLISIP
jgi:hypothetical protein